MIEKKKAKEGRFCTYRQENPHTLVTLMSCSINVSCSLPNTYYTPSNEERVIQNKHIHNKLFETIQDNIHEVKESDAGVFSMYGERIMKVGEQ